MWLLFNILQCQTSEKERGGERGGGGRASIQTLDSPGSLQIISMFIVVPNVNTPFDRGFVFLGEFPSLHRNSFTAVTPNDHG